jgi:pimeloyl-ACP methyl ester carboxylesterase
MSATADRQTVKPPSKLLLFAEGRFVWETWAGLALWPALQLAPRGDGHAVLVLPGLATSDVSTELLRRYLASRGYAAHGWGLGRNLGPRAGVEQGMIDRLQQLKQQSGRKVSIIGWSLGGVYARMLATRFPEAVRSVITLGSPIAGSGRATNAWRLYEYVSGEAADDEERWQYVRPQPPVPTTSIYSRTDGVVAWPCSLEQVGKQAENIEILGGSHLGMGTHPAVLYAVADRLAQPEGAWKPFDGRWLPLLYPKPASR